MKFQMCAVVVSLVRHVDVVFCIVCTFVKTNDVHAIRPHGGGILSTTYILYMLLVVSRYLLHSVEEADSKKSTSRVFLTEYEIYLLCDIISKFESSVIDWYVSCRERAMV